MAYAFLFKLRVQAGIPVSEVMESLKPYRAQVLHREETPEQARRRKEREFARKNTEAMKRLGLALGGRGTRQLRGRGA